MALGALLFAAFVGLANGLGATDTITWGGDNSRASYQTNHNMDPSVVGTSAFGQLFKTQLPGVYAGAAEQIFSMPLVYTPSGGTKQYVYVATTQNNVYKLDAKTGAIIASRNLALPFLSADLNGCVDITPCVGVTSTGVIDPDTDTLYLTSKTYADQTQVGVAQGKPAGRYFLHALNVNDLSEQPNFPINLEGTVARNNPIRSFNGGIHHQRPALLHTGQFIYAGFASHCVQYNFTGWIMGWDKTTGNMVEHYAMEGKGVSNQTPGGGVWMSGGGLASDDAGSIWHATGNGYASQLATVPVPGFNPPTSLEEAAVHWTINGDGSLNLVDFFMPWEKQALDGADKDLGTSPLELLPSQFSCGSVKRMGCITGKSGKTYWLDMDNLGGYRMGGNGPNGLDAAIQVYQNENSVYAGAGVYPLEGGYIYINVIQHPTAVFKFSCTGGVASFTKVAVSPETNAYILGVSHGTTTSLNGQPGTGLLWVTDVQGLNLRIYNAVPKNGLLTLINSFNIPGVNKFYRPVFGDGIVYVGTNQGAIYGFGSPVNTPMNCTSPTDFGDADIGAASAPQTVTCTALVGVTVTGVALDETTNFNLSSLPTLPLQLAAGKSFTFQAQFVPTVVGLISSDVLVNTTNAVAGYSTNTHARLVGNGQSSGPLLSVSPNTITFQGIVMGQDPNGVTETLIMNNLGNGPLHIQSVQYSASSTTGPWETWSGNGDLDVGMFTLHNIPTTLAAESSATVSVQFNTSQTGTFSGFVNFISDGGNQTLAIAGSAGPAPISLLEFQTPDGTGWVKYVDGTPFTFGNVTENKSRGLLFRITNAAPAGGINLSLTVSKPPFGVAGLVRSANNVDLAEGTSLAPGQNATALLTCAVPKSQWDVDPYNGTAQWTLNTNDPVQGKLFIQFFCQAVSEQAPPLIPGSDQGRYRYIGCYKENNPGRQLSNQLYGNVNNTNPMCIAACAAKNYVFCGTQYQTECWGGNKIPIQQVDDANCDYFCNGDINQICGGNGVAGGGAYISLFADALQFNGTTNTTTPTQPTGPVVNPGVDGFVSIGCYTESTTGRALPNGVQTSQKTVQQCVDACGGKYKYAGLEYGGECWCGNSFTAGSVPAPITDCSMTCNDNQTEYCGGPSRLNVYQLNTTVSTTTSSTITTTTGPTVTGNFSTTAVSTTTSSTPTGPSVNPGIDGYSSIGCYTEGTGTRALPNFLATTPQTVAKCLDACSAKNYLYAGVEYGGECWCGNAFGTGAVPAPITDCSMLCNGNPNEYCGGSNRLNVYQLGGGATTTSTSAAATGSATSGTASSTTVSTSSSSPTPTGPSVNPGTNGYSSIGCYTEGNNTRALPNLIKTTSETVALCLAACSAQNYVYAGLEYGGECWCANAFGNGAVPAPITDCKMTCNQNTTEYCGGPSRLNVYQLGISSSTTSSTSTTSPSATGSSTLASGSATTTAVSTTTTSVGSTSTTTTTSSSPTPTGPFVNPGTNGYSSIGCYTEGNNTRALPNLIKTTSQTVALCLAACSAQNYVYAGLEYGGECWCANAFGNGAVPAPITDCKMTCNQNTTEYCGGPNRLNVYQLGTTTSTSTSTSTSTTSTSTSPTSGAGSSTAASVSTAAATTTTATTTTSTTTTTTTTSSSPTPTGPFVNPGTNGYSSIGCYTEGNNTRALPNFIKTTNQTVALCLAACSAQSYVYAGLEYGGECWCANAFGQGAVPAPITDCKMTCNQNTTEYCGGSNRLNVYQLGLSTSTSSTSAATSTSTTGSPLDAGQSTSPATTSTAASTSTTSTSLASPTSATTSTTSAAPSTTSTSTSSSSVAPSTTSTSSTTAAPSTTSSTSTSSSSTAPSTTSTTSTSTSSTSAAPTTTSTSTSTTSTSKTTTSTTSSATPTQTGPIVLAGNANFTFYSCMSEPSSGKLMDSQVYNNATTMTPELCLSKCWMYKWAGVEYGQECWCGNNLNINGNKATATPGANVSSTQCNTICPGNKLEYCGKGNRLLLYIRNTTTPATGNSKRWSLF